MNATFLDTFRLDIYNNVENFTSEGKIWEFSSLLGVLLVKFLKEPDVKKAKSRAILVRDA